jgi:CubicO group peptidase (beta-lactamase class C family)|tara:strand:+ start:80 stop:1174 length:1095 start_codon:yes stop_codon:yes gene_type:complete
MKKILLLLLIIHCSCSNNETQISEPVVDNLYFPSIDSDQWETITPEELNWDSIGIGNLYDFLELNNTRAFIVLKNGKIVLENYWGNNIQNTAPFDKNSNWYWASAGKTLTAFLVGIAQDNGLLSIEDSSSIFLGNGWTSLEESQESLIKIKHQLTMTTGLDYEGDNLNCTTPNCLTYKNTPGTNWFYHNATYTLLKDVIENSSETTYNDFTNQKVKMKIGMGGSWIQSNYNNIYWSTALDMARFGLLMLNEGAWDDQVILNDANYFSNMINTSQQINESYGYLWWLNGKDSLIPPGTTIPIQTSLASNAPDDLIAGMGKNGQYLDVIPSQNLVIIRMGEAPDADDLVPINFHNEMWSYLNDILF